MQAYLLFQVLECLLHMLRAVALLQELLFQLLASVWPRIQAADSTPLCLLQQPTTKNLPSGATVRLVIRLVKELWRDIRP